MNQKDEKRKRIYFFIAGGEGRLEVYRAVAQLLKDRLVKTRSVQE